MKKEIFLDLKNRVRNWKFVNKIQKVFSDIKKTVFTFSIAEKLVFRVLLAISVVSIVILTVGNENIVRYQPDNGGSLTEGSIGTPRFINPILVNPETSKTDLDLTKLIYSGLMRAGEDGNLIPDLAESYEVSEDQLLYTFKIREDAVFHDGQPVTADDIIFTILKAQNPNIRTFKRAEWEGIILQKIDDKTVSFELKSPYSNFLNNTTIGILPKHIWHEIPADSFSLNRYNLEPIGSGPYKISRIKKDNLDIPISYTLKSFKDFTLGRPYIDKVIFKFAKNEDELVEMYRDGEIESINSLSPTNTINLDLNDSRILRVPTSRIFGIFFNTSESPALADSAVRRALEASISKEEIVDDIFFGFADVADSPISSNLQPFSSMSGSEEEDTSRESKIETARLILEKDGWEKNDEGIYFKEDDGNKVLLSLSISVSNIEEFIKVSETIASTWREVGINVDVKIFGSNDFKQEVLRPRNFESLLFAMIIRKDSDFYAFWHSSQRNDPGLNITNYANIEVDEILEDIRENSNAEERSNLLLSLDKEINQDKPAVFLYTPQFIYLIPNKIKGIVLNNIITADDRFNNIHKWYIETDRILNLWNKN